MTFDRRSLGRNGHALVSTALEADGFLAAFTERTGGSSPRPYDSLNLSYFVADEEDLVRKNRHTVVDSLGIPPFATAEQVHGTRLVRVGAKRAGTGFDDREGRIRATDALSTTSASVALAVLTADCVPVVAVSPSSGLLVVAHLGWRGIAAGLVGTVAALFDDPKEARVALGPAIGPDHYEVG